MFQPQPTPFIPFHPPPPSFGANSTCTVAVAGSSSSSYPYFQIPVSSAAGPPSQGLHLDHHGHGHAQVPPAPAAGDGDCICNHGRGIDLRDLVAAAESPGYPSLNPQRRHQPSLPSTTFDDSRRGFTTSPASETAANFALPSFHHAAAQHLFGAPHQQPQSFHHQLPSQPHYRRHQDRPNPPGITGLKMEQSPDSEIAQQEAAARAYQPQLEGALVGDKTASQAITAEYAKADPTYVTKTIALSQTYSHYRPIQGDGNCGWRAIGFSYFEQLIQKFDRGQIQNELDRLTGLSDFIEKVGGHDRWLFEDMVSETLDLLQEILTCVTQGQDAMPLLMRKINDREVSAAIVYHLRLLAASWLKGNSADLEPYLDTDITTYIEGTVLPTDVEIDHISVKVLVDVLLKPANMVLEIAYLDRSIGDKVNVHRMPEEANGQDLLALGPMIHLLYRPGHYDVLYNEGIIPSQPLPISSTDLQVNRAMSFTQHQQIQGTIPLQEYMSMNMSTLALIPGFNPPDMSMLPSHTSSAVVSGLYSPSPVSWTTPPYGEAIAETSPTSLPQQDMGFPQQHPVKPMTVHPLRFSKYNFPSLPEMNEGSPTKEPTFTTSLFKNSHFNTAHYSNNNFQPEMYSPDS